MKRLSSKGLDSMWARHHAEWRDPAQIASQWQEASEIDPDLLQFSVRGSWWPELEKSEITLLVTREYEHLLVALTVMNGRPVISYMLLPHPSGLVVDRKRRVVYVASTRNPNQVYDFRPVRSLVPRQDVALEPLSGRPLVPVRSRFYPGSAYLHDLALIGGVLHANAVGQNAVVCLDAGGDMRRVWWPRCIESLRGPVFTQNQIQLNSIAAGSHLTRSYFSASTDKISYRRPGHRNFSTDRRGVIFDGDTREPMARGLTRPHSARLHRNQLWVANSGYGELGVIRDGTFVTAQRLPGWTRGLCFHGGVAYVGTSRIIPRFRHYAPGLEVETSICGLHAVDIATGRVLGSFTWPHGNQIFGLDWAPKKMLTGFPFLMGAKRSARIKKLFYAFDTRSISRSAYHES
jgi:uncharacterized protein (TIGR03032 family)